MIEDSTTEIYAITYAPFGPVSGLTYGNGLTESRSYDQDYRLTGITVPAVLDWTLTDNADDDITAITDNLTSANNQALGYDVLNRPTTAAGNYGNQGFSYDADGNRTQLNLGGVLTPYVYAAGSNRLTKVNTTSRSYDADGNTTHDGSYVYAYDNANRLASATKGANTDTYLYNALGQRVEKTVGATTTIFLYDESGHLIGEYTPSGGLIEETVWLNARPIGVVTPTGLYYVTTDQLSAPRAITNANKQIVWQWSSDPFGNGAPTGSLVYNLKWYKGRVLKYQFPHFLDSVYFRHTHKEIRHQDGVNTYDDRA
ncbi:MAG: hypothetical protein ACRESX_04850 [Gammaproteobacteria bacterium]